MVSEATSRDARGRYAQGNRAARALLAVGFDPAAFRDDRQDAGLTLAALAQRAGVMPSTLHRWESGRRRPYATTFGRVLRVLLEAEEAYPDWRWRRRYSGDELATLRMLEVAADGLWDLEEAS